MANYILCPRCELNFIDEDEQEYCEVCMKELTGEKSFVDNLEEEESGEETELCPLCGENRMRFGEEMCEECKKKSVYEDEVDDSDDEDDFDKNKTWEDFADMDDDEEDIDIGIDKSEFEDEYEDEEEEFEETAEDDFEYVSADDYSADDDEDDDDDDDDDDF